MKTPRILVLTALPLLAMVPAAWASSSRGSIALQGSRALAPNDEPPSSDGSALETSLREAAPTLEPRALHAALASWSELRARGEATRPVLTVIDYSLPSTDKRLWVFDLTSHRLMFHELVAHGRNTGENLARSFSNEDGSLMTSLGAFVTGTTYAGKNGYSMRLRGMEPSLNDHAEARTIVVHGAWYVGEDIARKQGRLGRSHGCPALRPAITHELIDGIKDGTVLYAWHPSIDGSKASGGSASVSTVAGRGEAVGDAVSRGEAAGATLTR